MQADVAAKSEEVLSLQHQVAVAEAHVGELQEQVRGRGVWGEGVL